MRLCLALLEDRGIDPKIMPAQELEYPVSHSLLIGRCVECIAQLDPIPHQGTAQFQEFVPGSTGIEHDRCQDEIA